MRCHSFWEALLFQDNFDVICCASLSLGQSGYWYYSHAHDRVSGPDDGSYEEGCLADPSMGSLSKVLNGSPVLPLEVNFPPSAVIAGGPPLCRESSFCSPSSTSLWDLLLRHLPKQQTGKEAY